MATPDPPSITSPPETETETEASTTTNNSQSTSAPAPRAAQACDACKRRKVRCNGEEQCQQCKHFDLKCVYTPIKRGRPRKNAAARGAVIEEYRRSTSHEAQGAPSQLGSNGLTSPGLPSPTSAGGQHMPMQYGLPSFEGVVDGLPDQLTIAKQEPLTSPPALTQSPSSLVLPRILLHPDPGYFLDLIPDYLTFVYPVNPVIPEAEIRRCVAEIHTNREAACFLYSFAAVTINLTRSEQVQFAPDIKDQIAALLNRSFDQRDPMTFQSEPSLLKIYTNIFVQICLLGLRRNNLGFFYLREAISMVHMLNIDSPDAMAQLSVSERARHQRTYWECFIHERFLALSDFKPICLRPLPSLPERDPDLERTVEEGWNHIIQTFVLIDQSFVDYWTGDRSQITVAWVERKHAELDDAAWMSEVSILTEMQQADLIITRQWLRTLTWQMAMSNFLLSRDEDATSEQLSLTMPLKLSSQLRHFLSRLSHTSVGIHGTGILNKLFEITDTIADVVIHLPRESATREDTLHRVDDILFLKRFMFSFPRMDGMHKRILMGKFERMRERYPEMEEIELLVGSPLSLTSSAFSK